MPGKSISIAAPASYWYLKGFPIAEMAQVVNYIVFMTYDLHGQVGIPLFIFFMLTVRTVGCW